jgi:hypothetical protein
MRWTAPPSFLSHVTGTIEALESILKSRSIWAARSTEVRGDDSELRTGEELAENVARELMTTALRPLAQKAMQEFLAALPSERISKKAKVYIACFTDEIDESHWRTYGGAGSGIAITFNVVPPNRRPPPGLDLALVPVEYDPDAVKARLADAFRQAIDLAQMAELVHDPGWASARLRPMILRLAGLFAVQTKHKSFAHEREWRIAALPAPGSESRIVQKPFEHVAVELNPGRMPDVREIRIGPTRPDPETLITRVKRFLRENGYGDTVTVRVG